MPYGHARKKGLNADIFNENCVIFQEASSTDMEKSPLKADLSTALKNLEDLQVRYPISIGLVMPAGNFTLLDFPSFSWIFIRFFFFFTSYLTYQSIAPLLWGLVS